MTLKPVWIYLENGVFLEAKSFGFEGIFFVVKFFFCLDPFSADNKRDRIFCMNSMFHRCEMIRADEYSKRACGFKEIKNRTNDVLIDGLYCFYFFC